MDTNTETSILIVDDEEMVLTSLNAYLTLETEYKNYEDPVEVDHENAYAISYLKSIGWDVSDHG